MTVTNVDAAAAASNQPAPEFSRREALAPAEEAGRFRKAKPFQVSLQRGSLKPSVDSVVKAFNSWAFKREQPAEIDRLRALVADAIDSNKPLSFVLYWGRGPRSRIASPEQECLAYIAMLAHRVQSIHYAGAAITLVFTDTHAKLNGYSESSTKQYFAEVEHAAAERGFKVGLLSDLVERAGNCVEAAASEPPPSQEMLNLLVESAMKWYRGEGTALDGALRYYQANMIEKRAMRIAFPDSIFVTFNGSAHRPLFPSQMPIFYMYSLRRGFGVKPWFMSDEAVDANSASASSGAAV